MPSKGLVKWRWTDPEWEPEENDSPEFFGVDAPMSKFQLDFLERAEDPLLILQTGVGAGKTRVAAWTAVTKMLDGWRILCIAQNSKALKMVLFRDIIKILMTVLPDYDPSKYYNKTEGHIGMPADFGEACCDGGTDENPSGILGFTEYDGIIFDEASRICLEMRNNATDRNRGKGIVPWERYLSSPNKDQPEPWFAEMCKNNPDCVIRATSLDNEFTTEEYKRRLKARYIEGSPMYRQQVLGEILENSIAAAIIRLEDFPKFSAISADETVVAGLDCGEGVERDATAFFKRKGNKVLEMWKLNGINHEECVAKIRKSNKECRIDKLNMDMAFSDYEYNILKYEMPCEQVSFARSPSEDNKEKYANVRAEMFFNLAHKIREGMCVDGFDLSPELKKQLCTIQWRMNNQRRLLLTPKEELRTILNMSTDIADAAALTCVELSAIDNPLMVADRVVSGVTAAEEEQIMSEY